MHFCEVQSDVSHENLTGFAEPSFCPSTLSVSVGKCFIDAYALQTGARTTMLH